MVDDQHDHEGGAAQIAAEQQAAARPSLTPTTSTMVSRDRDKDVEDRGEEVGAGALVEADSVSRYSNSVATQNPPIAIRASSIAPGRPAGGGGGALLRAARPRERDQRADGRDPEQRGEGGADYPGLVLVLAIVEAQDRLDQAEADDDAGGDDRGEHDFGGAVVGPGEVAR